MSTTPLQQCIIERIQQEGAITFAEYMHMALYEPNYGYYVSGSTKIGWEGDYYTSTDVSHLFASCMGRQLSAMWEQLDRPTHFPVLEQGSGRGHLAQAICSWAARHAYGDFSAALDYQTEDICAGQDALHNPALSRPLVILSNELIDAFPVHIVEAQNKRLYEIYVDVHAGHLCERVDEPSTPAIAQYLDIYDIPWQTFDDGWRAEINLNALSWLAQSAKRLQGASSQLTKRGFILTIDYGDEAQSLYTSSRLRGTLTCYSHHRMNWQAFARPGEQDITSHVNFSALIKEGARYGLHVDTFTTQRDWLEGTGIFDELECYRNNELAAADTERASDRGQTALLRWYDLRQRVTALTDPAGMGNFKVLILRY